MPDVTKLLNQDHRKVEQLFEQFEATEDPTIALQICEELTIHTQIEETVVYPSLQEIDGELGREARKEHDEAKQLIARIQGMDGDDAALVETMTTLKAAVEHHVKEEETEAWPKMRDKLDASRLEQMGTKLEQEKQRLIGTGTTTGSTGARQSSAQASALIDLTKEELYEKAKEANIEGRSSMTKDELIDALQRTS